MNSFKDEIIRKRIDKVIANLEKNNMKGYFAENCEEALEIVSRLISEGATVAAGGSVTLKECGILDMLENGNFNYLDRNAPDLTEQQINDIYVGEFSADVYLSSSNAITECGDLYNVDGRSNRTAAILFGPRSVIIVAGRNKIVRDIDEAAMRVKKIAAPANCRRLGCNTFCENDGECVSTKGKSGEITDGCKTSARICCNYVISSYQRIKDRIKVIIVNEDLGY